MSTDRNTYLVYVHNISDRMQPTITAAYIQASKYGPAWKAARALTSTGKPHAEVPEATTFYSDAECKKKIDFGFGDHVGVSTVVDMRQKKEKLNTEQLTSIFADKSLTDAQKLEQATKLLGAAKPAPAAAAA